MWEISPKALDRMTKRSSGDLENAQVTMLLRQKRSFVEISSIVGTFTNGYPKSRSKALTRSVRAEGGPATKTRRTMVLNPIPNGSSNVGRKKRLDAAEDLTVL